MQYDVFLSHNSADKPVVEQLALKLRKAGVSVFFDKWDLVPGERWQESLEKALEQSASCAVFLGSVGFGKWEEQEMRAALDRRAAMPGFRVIPVLLPGAKPEDLPPFLKAFTGQKLEFGPEEPEAFRRLLHGIRGEKPGPPPEDAALEESECPFRGLEVFKAEHAKYFCGRDELTSQLVKRLGRRRFLVVIGVSGSGKSSLIRAGLLPALEQGALPGSEHWKVVFMRPDREPLGNLAYGLTKHLPGGEDSFSELKKIRSEMQESSRTLHLTAAKIARSLGTKARVLIVVDQFEELFTQSPPLEKAAFLENLLEATTGHSGRTKVVISMRADFQHLAQVEHEELQKRLESSQFYVGTMSESELLQVIEIPAQRAGFSYEDGLVERILEEVRNQVGSLPFLEHALKELWKQRQGTQLTFEGYETIEGVEGSLARWAENVYQQLETPQRKKIARGILLELVQLGDEIATDTKRRVKYSNLAAGNADEAEFDFVVETLTSERLLTTNTDQKFNERTIELAHETLLHSWPKYNQWLHEERDDIVIGRYFERRLRDWKNAGQDPAELLGGRRLEEVKRWSARRANKLTAPESEFLKKSLFFQQEAEQKDQELEQLRKERAQISAGKHQTLLPSELIEEKRNEPWLTEPDELFQEADVAELLDTPVFQHQLGIGSDGFPFDRNPWDLSQAGWGVIFPDYVDPVIREQLSELFSLRSEQSKDMFKMFVRKRSESASSFCARHGEPTGTTRPDRIPYYLLIVGDPQSIPFNFQQELSRQHAVGRVQFDTLEHYRKYAVQVIRAEQGLYKTRDTIELFSPNDHSEIMSLMNTHFAEPIYRNLQTYLKRTSTSWEIRLASENDAKKSDLIDILAHSSPSLLLLNCGARSLRPGHEDQKWAQGSLICQEAPGEQRLFGAGDIPKSADLEGQIVLFFSSYGVGCQVLDNFPHEGNVILPRVLTPKPFISALPQALLGHGALAALGRIGRSWTNFFTWGKYLGTPMSTTETVEDSLKRLIRGERLGHAIRPMIQRYLVLSDYLLSRLDKARIGIAPNQRQLEFLWTAVNDAKNFIILGDPAVFLPGHQRVPPGR